MLNSRLTIILFGFLAVLLTSGCAVTVSLPITHFDTPETIGESVRFKADTAYVASDEVVLTNDYTLTGPSVTNPVSIGWTPYVRFGGGMSLNDRFDLELKSLKALQGKFQFIGTPRSRAEKDNFSLAVTGLLGFDNQSSTSSGFSNNNTYQVKHNAVPLQLGLIAGYRFDKLFLMYVGGFYRSTSVWGDYTVTGAPGSYHYNGTASASTGTVGMEIGNRLAQVILEVGYGKLKMGTQEKNEVGVGLQASFMFGGNSVLEERKAQERLAFRSPLH